MKSRISKARQLVSRGCVALPLIAGLVSCAAFESDQWSWLGDSERQQWQTVVIQAYGREVRFSVPDRRDKSGEHVRIWPDPVQEGSEQHFTASLDAITDPLLRIAQFRWDEYWNGFYKPQNRDFILTIDAHQPRDRQGLLDLSAEERMQLMLEEHKQSRQQTNSILDSWTRQYYWIRTYETPFHVWVVENQPQLTWRHEFYFMPLTDDIELVFMFFVRQNRWDSKDDPQWRESRWAIVRQIMDTVQITPSPFPDEP